MELLDRYLQAVRRHLPLKRQDDIIAELRANILASVEDQEAALGRPLSEAEQEAVLKQHGHPLLVAVRYLPQRSLIGPALFPFYWSVLRAGLLVAAITYATITTALLIAGTPSLAKAIGMVLHFPAIALTVMAWTTLAFAAMEFIFAKYKPACRFFENWSPRSLPPVKPSGRGQFNFHLVCGFIAEAILTLWFAALPRLLFGPGGNLNLGPFQLAPVWIGFYRIIVLLMLGQLAVRFVSLFRLSPEWVSRTMNLIVKGIGLFVLFSLLQTRDYLVLPNPVHDVQRYTGMLTFINYNISICLKIGVVITLLELLWTAGRLVAALFRPSTAHSGVHFSSSRRA